jgi:hypothetical protein
LDVDARNAEVARRQTDRRLEILEESVKRIEESVKRIEESVKRIEESVSRIREFIFWLIFHRLTPPQQLIRIAFSTTR